MAQKEERRALADAPPKISYSSNVANYTGSVRARPAPQATRRSP
jgi:hypothetical protein